MAASALRAKNKGPIEYNGASRGEVHRLGGDSMSGRCDDIACDAELDDATGAWREEVGPQRHCVPILVHVRVRAHVRIRKVDVGVVPGPHRTQHDDETRRALEVELDRLLLHQQLAPAGRLGR